MAKRTELSGDVDLNLTPMIDVVFQLIIFFMVVTELSNLEADHAVVLPHVDSRPDVEADPGRLVLNVTDKGAIKCMGHVVRSNKELWMRLKADADLARPRPDQASNRTILIRADKRTEFRRIEDILYYCTDPSVRIWKLSFGAAFEPGEEKKEE